MVKILTTCAACAVALAGCATSSASVASPAPAAVASADTPAAGLRAHMDLLLGEHTFILAKLSVAAAGGRKGEYRSYAGLLAANGANLTDLVGASIGRTEGTQFDQAWTDQNNFFVDYLVATVTHDQSSADAAMSRLTGTYVPQLAGFLGSAVNLPVDPATQMTSDQVAGTKALIDDVVAGDFSKMYAELRAAYAKAATFGSAIATRIAQRFADRLPGDARGKAADLRASLDALLQEQAYLITMASDATVAGKQAELSAASDAVGANTKSLSALLGGVFGSASGTQVGRVWSDETALLIGYAKSGDQAGRQSALNAAAPSLGSGSALSLDLTPAIDATLQAIDDQRQQSPARLADDDRAAAAQFAAVGDAVTNEAVREMPAKFA